VQRIIIVTLVVAVLGGCDSSTRREHSLKPINEGTAMRLGNFSVSLAVKDIAASRAFYEKLGFRVFGGDQAKNWLILQNETCTVGLFQGMFDKNMLTFNPGWDRACNTLTNFDDVRDIQQQLKAKGITLAAAADEASTGPASLMVVDPDGNPILFDQHVPRPAK
jgi:catechol 2,3-dioxygenase-like lactoylglutathione lyase family enzyme